MDGQWLAELQGQSEICLRQQQKNLALLIEDTFLGFIIQMKCETKMTWIYYLNYIILLSVYCFKLIGNVTPKSGFKQLKV